MQAASETYYAVLGVDADATREGIAKAYRQRALLLHPDRQSFGSADATAAAFAQLTEAYEVLSDDVRRACYDSCLQERRRAAQVPRPSTTHDASVSVPSDLLRAASFFGPSGNSGRSMDRVPLAHRPGTAAAFTPPAALRDNVREEWDGKFEQRSGRIGRRPTSRAQSRESSRPLNSAGVHGTGSVLHAANDGVEGLPLQREDVTGASSLHGGGSPRNVHSSQSHTRPPLPTSRPPSRAHQTTPAPMPSNSTAATTQSSTTSSTGRPPPPPSAAAARGGLTSATGGKPPTPGNMRQLRLHRAVSAARRHEDESQCPLAGQVEGSDVPPRAAATPLDARSGVSSPHLSFPHANRIPTATASPPAQSQGAPAACPYRHFFEQASAGHDVHVPLDMLASASPTCTRSRFQQQQHHAFVPNAVSHSSASKYHHARDSATPPIPRSTCTSSPERSPSRPAAAAGTAFSTLLPSSLFGGLGCGGASTADEMRMAALRGGRSSAAASRSHRRHGSSSQQRSAKSTSSATVLAAASMSPMLDPIHVSRRQRIVTSAAQRTMGVFFPEALSTSGERSNSNIFIRTFA